MRYRVNELAPGFFAFASDGGGELLALTPEGGVVTMPFVGMNPVDAFPVADTWAEFLRYLAPDDGAAGSGRTV